MVLALLLLLIFRHESLQDAAHDSLSFVATKLIPSLFPFAVLSRFLLSASLIPCRGKVALRVAGALRLAAPLLPAYCLGLFCGFPIGAYAAASVLESGLCRESSAYRSASLSNNASIAFLCSASSLFQNTHAPIILFASQTAATLLVSLLTESESEPIESLPVETASYLALAADAIGKAGLAMLSLSSFVVFFAVLTKALLLIGLPAWITLFWEPTAALRYAASLAPKIGLTLSLSLASLALGWSGFSVIMQTQALFRGKMPLAAQTLCRAKIALVSFSITFLSATLLGS